MTKKTATPAPKADRSPFHLVRRSHNEKAIGHEIWFMNRPLMTVKGRGRAIKILPKGQPISRAAARVLTRQLNRVVMLSGVAIVG